MNQVQMGNLRGFLGILQNARIRELCGVTKGVDERSDEGVLRWFGHVERMENDGITKRVYVGELAGSRAWVALERDGLVPRRSV